MLWQNLCSFRWTTRWKREWLRWTRPLTQWSPQYGLNAVLEAWASLPRSRAMHFNLDRNRIPICRGSRTRAVAANWGSRRWYSFNYIFVSRSQSCRELFDLFVKHQYCCTAIRCWWHNWSENDAPENKSEILDKVISQRLLFLTKSIKKIFLNKTFID